MANDPIQSWVDVDEVKRLAAELTAPSTQSVKQASDSTPTQEAAVNAGASLADARSKADKSGVIAKKTPVTPLPPQVSSRPPERPVLMTPGQEPLVEVRPKQDPFHVRLQDYANWLRSETGGQGVFVFDGHHKILFDELDDPRIAEAVKILGASQQIMSKKKDGDPSSLCLEIENGRVLSIVSAVTERGLLTAGIIAKNPLNRQLVEKAAHMLEVSGSKRDTENS